MSLDRGDLGAEVYETHTGLVALVGDRAYKVKKPVRTDFLDFSTRDKRESACRRELKLNRRLAPAAYLGLGSFQPPTGDPEPVIVMRRYPDAERLAALVRAGDDVQGWLVTIAGILAGFHRTADRGPMIDREATAEVLAARWRQNLTELRRHTGTVLDEPSLAEIERLAERYLAGRGPLYADRIAAGRVVDGHGDLLTQDIFCTADGPVMLDCLEFDDQLRYVDGVDDASFLAMDLEFLGRPDLGALFLDEYCRRADDTAPVSLRHFCIAYRATVRAKTDCVRAGQGRTDSAPEAQHHLSIALAHLRMGSVRLVMVGGGPGTGKTTVARGLAERLDAEVISTDDVRRELIRAGEVQGRAGELGAGLYAPENVSAVYGEVLNRARAWLGAGHSVVLDGTWRDAGHRRHAHAVAAETHSSIVELRCALPVSEAQRRIATRGATTSDATPELAAELARWEADWPGAHPVDTAAPLPDTVAAAHRVCLDAL
ncbi:AAA family ATPase [Mycobacterium sp. ITM-2016-00317]|uniref:bifunctional aminoglycoside phosphotransferase/ATP-binding protein n=1 Tax=Mycobacterium sp. ITM-2016-00317 TaxID=2099694 RepID=UPI00287FE7B1|nr:AAA family ATPase [Mycobacterium sp. ITM-2016-00317]WNG88736.1 AAA family ATPase [Mycobacterium sp. ITM-2016-00317]